MKTIAQTLEVSRSNLLARVKGQTKPQWRYHKAQDAAFVPLVKELVSRWPTYSYRQITTVLNRILRKMVLNRSITNVR